MATMVELLQAQVTKLAEKFTGKQIARLFEAAKLFDAETCTKNVVAAYIRVLHKDKDTAEYQFIALEQL